MPRRGLYNTEEVLGEIFNDSGSGESDFSEVDTDFEDGQASDQALSPPYFRSRSPLERCPVNQSRSRSRSPLSPSPPPSPARGRAPQRGTRGRFPCGRNEPPPLVSSPSPSTSRGRIPHTTARGNAPRRGARGPAARGHAARAAQSPSPQRHAPHPPGRGRARGQARGRARGRAQHPPARGGSPRPPIRGRARPPPHSPARGGSPEPPRRAPRPAQGVPQPPPRGRFGPELPPGWVRPEQGRPSEFQFLGQPGITVPHGRKPIDYINLFLTDELIQHIVDQTNLYAEQVIRNNPLSEFSRVKAWEPTTPGEMRKFIGLNFLMGIIRKPTIQSYWSSDPLIRTSIFGQTMSRDRFLLILRFLHFADNEQRPEDADRLYKIQPIIDMLNESFQRVYNPQKEVSVDETLLLFKGRLVFKQFLPLKRSRFGIKLFVCCDKTGYTYKFRIYQGREGPTQGLDNDLPDDAQQMKMSEKVVLWLTLGLLQQGHTVFTDNWYTSIELVEYLNRHDTGSCGTIRANRVPAYINNKKLQKGESFSMRKGSVLLTKYTDKKDVYLASNVHDVGVSRTRRGKEKPEIVVEYNKYMGAVDKKDQVLHAYDCTRKAYKWYKKVVFHCFQVVLYNGFLLAKTDGYHKTFLNFQLEVIEALTQTEDNPYPTETDDDVRLAGRHFPDKTDRKQQKRCRVCYRKDRVRRETSFYCPHCPSLPGLCVPDCFRVYHTKRHYWQAEE